MDFLESHEIAQEAVKVMKEELEAMMRRAPALEAESVTLLGRTDEGSTITQNLIVTLTRQAEEHSLQNAVLRNQIYELTNVIAQAKEVLASGSLIHNGTVNLTPLHADLEKRMAKNERRQRRMARRQEKIMRLEGDISGARQDKEDTEQALGLWGYYLEVLSRYPEVKQRPRHLTSEPVGWRWESLDGLLQYNEYTRSCSKKNQHFSCSLGWHGSHAVFLAPTHTLNPYSKRWEPYPFSKYVDGEIYHLFLRSGSYIRYRGSYRFLRIHDHPFSSIPSRYSQHVLPQIVDMAIPHPSSVRNIPRANRENLVLLHLYHNEQFPHRKSVTLRLPNNYSFLYPEYPVLTGGRVVVTPRISRYVGVLFRIIV